MSGISRRNHVSTKATIITGTAIRNTSVSAVAKASMNTALSVAGRASMACGVIVPWMAPVPPASSAVRRVLNSAPKMATPTEPPTERKKLTEDVATPRSLTFTEFCVARTSTCMLKPSPIPRIVM
jgi:hypothetical protein